MHALENAVLDDLRDRGDEMFAQLSEHVAIPTGKGYQPGLDEYRNILLDRLTALGASVSEHPGDPRPAWLDADPDPNRPTPKTVAARHTDAVPNAPRMLIAGHIDTVHDPNGAFKELTKSADGATALGPGAADMKGGILVALTALESLHRVGASVNWTFALNADEETGSFHSKRALEELARAHDVGLAIEPALPGGALAIERMGSGQFMIEVFGRSAHVGRDFAQGVSAVTRLGEILVELGRLPDLERGMIVSVGPIKGGPVTNAVPDHAAAWGNVRFKDPDSAAELERRILALATPEADALPRVVVHHDWNRPAKPLIPPTQRLADVAARAAEDIGQSLPFTSTGGVCDGNILQNVGLPTIDTLGVRGGGLHTTDEWIEVPSLVERASLMAVLLLRLSQGALPDS